MSDFLSVSEAARFLDVSPSTAYRAIEEGTFPIRVVRVSKRIKVPAAPLYALAGKDSGAVAAHGASDSPSMALVGSRGNIARQAS